MTEDAIPFSRPPNLTAWRHIQPIWIEKSNSGNKWEVTTRTEHGLASLGDHRTLRAAKAQLADALRLNPKLIEVDHA